MFSYIFSARLHYFVLSTLFKSDITLTKTIILASSSPRRKYLLEQIGLTPLIIPAGIEETMPPDCSPEQTAVYLSAQKAAHVAKNYAHGLIIGADTVVVHKHEILNKPESKEQAYDFLRRLSGETHYVITGVTLVEKDGNTERNLSFFERTEVTFGNLSNQEIQKYVASGSPMDKAGAYGIQDDIGALFVRKISGCYYNVVGFPLFLFYENLKQFAPAYLSLLPLYHHD